MRIALVADSVTYPLAGTDGVDERVHSSAGGLVIEAEAEVQDATYLRAARAAVWDRGNLRTTVLFSTTRLFATAAAAELFCLDYDATYPRAGTLVIAHDGAAARHLLGAVVDPPARRTQGCTALLDYRATGSELVVAL